MTSTENEIMYFLQNNTYFIKKIASTPTQIT